MFWTTLLSVAAGVVGLLTVTHVVLHKREARSGLLWVGLVMLVPFLGALLYFFFGINRIERRARRVRPQDASSECAIQAAIFQPPADRAHLSDLKTLVDNVVDVPLVGGNRVEPLTNGEEAYPAMWAAIDAAESTISLLSYIFNADSIGTTFVEKLAAARERGVEVRVLVDDTGARYSRPRIFSELEARGIPCASFHPRSRFLMKSTLNIRNHRKLCIVDGRIGFTGGMNIKREHMCDGETRGRVQDVHFRVEGPVVREMQDVFLDDWQFVTEEELGELWTPDLTAAGTAYMRGIRDGPSHDLNKLRWTVLGAIREAHHSIKIVTPYFLPDTTILSALNVAAIRGVQVDIVLPEHPNVALVRWAVPASLWQILEHGCRVWFQEMPFDHSKLMLVDDYWSMIGSANFDERSLRLNFEFQLECYCAEFGNEMSKIIEDKRARSTRVTLESLRARPLPIRVRDGLARLLQPIL